MSAMELTLLSKDSSNPKGDVVFIHGLGGNAKDTWTAKSCESSKEIINIHFPTLLSESIPDINVYSLDYSAEITNWTDNSRYNSFPRKCINILNYLTSSGIGKIPIIYICHSLGGLVVKQILRLSAECNYSRCNLMYLNTKAVSFIATPHSGSNLADIFLSINRIFPFIRGSETLETLEFDNSYLENLNAWYRSGSVKNGIETQAFYERKKTNTILVVPRVSADPCVSSCYPIGIDCDHISIAKPLTRQSEVFVNVAGLIKSILIENCDDRQRITQSQNSDNLIPDIHSNSCIEYPYGAISINSSLYIERNFDDEILDSLKSVRGIANILGARYTGKSSLIYRVIDKAKDIPHPFVPILVDFKQFSESVLKEAHLIWRELIDVTYHQLNTDSSKIKWEEDRPKSIDIYDFFDEVFGILKESRLLLCLDDVNLVLGQPSQGEFFRKIRHLWELGAKEPSLEKVQWLISTSTEPAFFIKDLNSSPFNIGKCVKIGPFGTYEAEKLSKLYGLQLTSQQLSDIIKFCGGWPWLLNIIYYKLSEGRHKTIDSQFFQIENYSSYTNRYLSAFANEPILANTLKEIINGYCCKDDLIAGRLEAAGLIVRSKTGKWICSCDLFSLYFGSHL